LWEVGKSPRTITHFQSPTAYHPNDQHPITNVHPKKTQHRLGIKRHASVAGKVLDDQPSDRSKPAPDTPTRRPEAGASMGRGTIRGILAAKVAISKSGWGDFGFVFCGL
jgi:hypothetical protein